jgi:hypothetical protein
MKANFLLGSLKITPEARRALHRLPYDLICRHAVGDYGQITEQERKANELGMKTLGRILSRYSVDPTNPHSPKVRISTEETWRETIVSIE